MAFLSIFFFFQNYLPLKQFFVEIFNIHFLVQPL